MSDLTTDSPTKILKAAAKLFAIHGYERTTLREVAEEAGVAKGLAFHHFGNKKALLTTVMNDFYTRQEAATLSALQGIDDPRERMHAAAEAFFNFAQENIGLQRLVFTISNHDEEGREVIRERLPNTFAALKSMISDVTPEEGSLSNRHFYISFSGIILSYFNFQPVLDHVWEGGMLSEESIKERKEHLHFMVDIMIDAIVAKTGRSLN